MGDSFSLHIHKLENGFPPQKLLAILTGQRIAVEKE